MAQECGAVIGAIDFLKRRHLDNFLINHQLNDARSQLVCVSLFQAKLEEVFLENTISTHVGALFQQANDGFSEICTHMNQLYTIKMAKPLEIFKLNNVAERLEAGSKPSISSREMILQVLEILRPENIAEKIKASKSSSKINTMKMVRFVDFSLTYVKDHALVDLRCLCAFFILCASRCIEHENMHDFFIHIENVAYTSLQLYFKWIDEYIHVNIMRGTVR